MLWAGTNYNCLKGNEFSVIIFFCEFCHKYMTGNKTLKFELLLYPKIAEKQAEVVHSDNWLPFTHFSNMNKAWGDLLISILYTFFTKPMCK